MREDGEWRGRGRKGDQGRGGDETTFFFTKFPKNMNVSNLWGIFRK